jgi:hypothetical protein
VGLFAKSCTRHCNTPVGISRPHVDFSLNCPSWSMEHYRFVHDICGNSIVHISPCVVVAHIRALHGSERVSPSDVSSRLTNVSFEAACDASLRRRGTRRVSPAVRRRYCRSMPLTRADHWAAHVANINALVDRLRDESGRFVPYVHQDHGGTSASILLLLRDPGRATARTAVLSTDNPDPTSRRQRELMAETGIRQEDVCPWNAFPYMWDEAEDGKLGPEAVARGASVLVRLLPLMTDLKAVLLQGAEARWAWAMVEALRPDVVPPGVEVARTCHPLGTRGRTPQQTADNKAAQVAAWRRVGALCRS